MLYIYNVKLLNKIFTNDVFLLQTTQGAEYEVLDDSQEHWWKVKDENGYIIFLFETTTQASFTNYFTNFFFYDRRLNLRHNLHFISHIYDSSNQNRQSWKIISYSSRKQ